MEKITKKITTMKEVVEDVDFWKTEDGTEFQSEREAYLHENQGTIHADFLTLMLDTNQFFTTRDGFIVFALDQKDADVVKDKLALDGYQMHVGEFPTTFPHFIEIRLVKNDFGRLIYAVNRDDEYSYAKSLVEFVERWTTHE